MFNDPLLKKLQELQRAHDDPQCDMLPGFDLLSEQDNAIQASMGPLDDKKAFEADRLRQFALMLGEGKFPDGRIESTEIPDFIIHTKDRRIGIELRYLIDQKMLWQERIADAAAKRAQQLHEQARGPHGHVSFVFEKGTTMKEKDALLLAEKLAKCVPWELLSATEPLHVSPRGISGLSWDEQSRIQINKDWPPELSFVTVWGSVWAQHKIHHWSVSHGGNVRPGEQFIQEALNDKEAKLPSYRKSGCDEVWLLVAVEGFHASGYISEPRKEPSVPVVI